MPWRKIVNISLPYIFIISIFLPTKIEPIYISSFLWLIIIAHFIFFGKDLVKSLDGLKVSYLIFTLFLIPISFFSIKVNSSLQHAIYLVQSFYILLITSQNFGYNYVKNILKFLIIIGTIFSVFSFSQYIEVGQLSNNYLDGMFGMRLVSASFVSFLLFISLYFSFKKNSKYNYLWILCSAILLNAIIYSGSYIFIIQTTAFFALYYFIKNKKLKRKTILNKEIVKKVIWLALITFIIYCGILYFARTTTLHNTDKVNHELTILNQKKINENNHKAVIKYVSDNLYLFLNKPFAGFGFGVGNFVINNFRETLSYGYFTEQYSLPLKILVETGIVSLIIFVTYIFQVTNKIYEKLILNSNTEIIYYSILLLSYFVYSLYSSNLSINQTYVIFIILVSLLYGYLVNGQYKKIGYYHRLFAYYFILISAIFCGIITMQISRSVMFKNIGLGFEKTDNSALTYLVHASSLNPLDSDIWYTIGQIYFSQNKFEQAKFSIERSIKNSPKDGQNYYAMALVYLGLDEKESYVENMIESIKINPVGNLNRYLILMKSDLEKSRIEEVKYYAGKIIKIYSEKDINVSVTDKLVISEMRELLGYGND